MKASYKPHKNSKNDLKWAIGVKSNKLFVNCSQKIE